MKKIGVLFGAENTFPGALVDRINSMHLDDVQAEFVRVEGVQMGAPSGYGVIVDRISHDLPFYRSYLKNAVLHGTQVINNPFWWSADDKFFNYALAEQLGVAVPHTVLLPHKQYPPEINAQSLRNLAYPLDWDAIFDYVRFPAFLKPHDGGGWRDVFHVHNRDEFFAAYDQTRDLCMTLQAAVNFTEYFRCYVVGQAEVRIMPYDPRLPHHLRYIADPPEYPAKLLKRVERDALTLCRALGYDLNTVEFAVEKGVPYAIDFMNPAPDADLNSVGKPSFDWIVDAMARLAVKKARGAGKASTPLHWAAFLSGASASSAPRKPLPKQMAAKSGPGKKAAAKRAPSKSR
ncbi:MAG TPA: hypothetical protein VNW54_10390 [Granulicella sp.]|jgi:hypothetical protein|nr:hypothetical protein [Granulicella sp.]